MRQRMWLPLVLILLPTVAQTVWAQPATQTVTINSVTYPKKVEPNAPFSVSATIESNDTNGWASVKLYSNGQVVQSPAGVWYGLGGKSAGSVANVTMSGITLAPNITPYNVSVVAFWTSLPSFAEVSQRGSQSFNITVVDLVLTADCLPSSVNATAKEIINVIKGAR